MSSANRKGKGITPSPKYGVNPLVELCFFCGKDKAIIMFGRLPNDVEAPRNIVMNFEPCEKCIERFEGLQAIALVEVRGDKIYAGDATGKYAVVKQSYLQKLVDNGILNNEIIPGALAKNRICLIEEGGLKALGLLTNPNVPSTFNSFEEIDESLESDDSRGWNDSDDSDLS